MRSAIKSLLPVLVAGTLSGCTPMWIQSAQYSGDGELRTCSNALGGGYDIEFPPFAAAKPYSASYRLAHVPQIGRDPQTYLEFQWDSTGADTDEVRKRVTAAFGLTLENTRGDRVQSVEVPLAKSTWTESGVVVGAYALDKSAFHFDRDASYILKVSYTPGAVPPPARQVYVRIDGCAGY